MRRLCALATLGRISFSESAEQPTPQSPHLISPHSNPPTSGSLHGALRFNSKPKVPPSSLASSLPPLHDTQVSASVRSGCFFNDFLVTVRKPFEIIDKN